ncbi:unnamed protein product [Vicia faba]|uniref:Disease resistance N-terminal domain-containing protein n=1 Tax=Vicia faba TaxID=3906 RepID=A0AAV0ZCE7_VICFA|nr:unnamed protein product [Vicia faba]
MNPAQERLAKTFVARERKAKKDVETIVGPVPAPGPALQVVLVDAEQKQFKDLHVKQRLEDLKDAIFYVEDLLNLISYEDFDVVRVTKSLLESVVRNTTSATSKVWESDNLDILRVELKKNSREK